MKIKGIGFLTMVFLIFLTLKLAQIGLVAKWNWWWVTAPLWIPVVLGILFVFLDALFATIYAGYKHKKRNKTKAEQTTSRFQKKLEEIADEKNNRWN